MPDEAVAESVETQVEEIQNASEELAEAETEPEWKTALASLQASLTTLHSKVDRLSEREVTPEVEESVTETEAPQELAIEEAPPTRKKRAKRFILKKKRRS